MTAPIVTAHSVGVPMESSAGAGSAAASRDEGRDVNTVLLKTGLRS